jgi:hypothetical protein
MKQLRASTHCVFLGDLDFSRGIKFCADSQFEKLSAQHKHFEQLNLPNTPQLSAK